MIAEAIMTLALAANQQAGVREEHDIAYVAAAVDQKLDVYVPSGSRGFPVVIFIHGGSLQAAAERRTSPGYAQVCPRLAARGIGCVTIDYRLAPPDRWPAMPQDVAAAVKWVKQNIAARGGDPARFPVRPQFRMPPRSGARGQPGVSGHCRPVASRPGRHHPHGLHARAERRGDGRTIDGGTEGALVETAGG